MKALDFIKLASVKNIREKVQASAREAGAKASPAEQRVAEKASKWTPTAAKPAPRVKDVGAFTRGRVAQKQKSVAAEKAGIRRHAVGVVRRMKPKDFEWAPWTQKIKGNVTPESITRWRKQFEADRTDPRANLPTWKSVYERSPRAFTGENI